MVTTYRTKKQMRGSRGDLEGKVHEELHKVQADIAAVELNIDNIEAGVINQLGDADDDSNLVKGFLSTKNTAGNSMYVSVADSSPSKERLWKVAGSVTTNTAGYFEPLYVNVKVPSTATPTGIVRGLESKATIEGNMGASAEAHGMYAKVNVSGASAEVSKAIGLDVLLEEEDSGTITSGTGVRVQGGSGAIHYGIDVSGEYGTGAVKLPFKTVSPISAASLTAQFGVAEGSTAEALFMGYCKDTADNKTYQVHMLDGKYKYDEIADAS